jgi:ubiquinone/menaquinone biosynthesis C-methylase UbiE
MADDHEQTENVREAWTAVAGGWERNADFIARTMRDVQAWLVDHIAVNPGQTVLELAAGPGDTGFEIARHLGNSGRLISTDISPAMTDAARRRAEAQGVTNVDFRVMDAQDMDLEDNSVDGVVHRFGPMLLPDPAASLREVRRVLHDGGRYAAAVWSSPEKNAWVLAMGMSLIMNGIELPGGDPNEPGGIFSLGEPDKLRSLVLNCGFSEADVEAVELSFEYKDRDETWIQPRDLSGPLSVIIAGLDAEKVAAVRKSYDDLMDQYRVGDRYEVPAQALCVAAR